MQSGANSNIFTAGPASLSLLLFLSFFCARTLFIFLPLAPSSCSADSCCLHARKKKGVCCLKALLKEEQREGLYCFPPRHDPCVAAGLPPGEAPGTCAGHLGGEAGGGTHIWKRAEMGGGALNSNEIWVRWGVGGWNSPGSSRHSA